MEALPWSVVYGAWVWRLALAGFVATGLVWSWWRPRRAARRNWRAAIDGCGEPVEPGPGIGGREITVAGRLDVVGPVARFDTGADAAVASIEGYATGAIIDRAAALAIETEAGRIDLEGGVDLLAGSGEAHPGLDPRRLGPEISKRVGDHVAVNAFGPVRFRWLGAGDRVRAFGTLDLVAASDGGNYREANHRFVLRGARLVSESPPRVSGPSPRRATKPLAVALAAFAILFVAGGEIAYQHGKQVDLSADDPDLDEAYAAHLGSRLAAMTPLRRDEALEEIDSAIGRATASVEVREALLAIRDLQGRCDRAASALLAYGRYRAALERADRCDTPVLAATAAYALGDLAGASDRLSGSPSRHAVRVHLLAGEPERAARAADQVAARYREYGDPDLERYVTGHGCIADAIRARAGDRESAARLETAVAAGSLDCRLLLADLRAGARRDELLVPWPESDVLGSYRLAAEARWLYLESDPIGRAAEVIADSALSTLLTPHVIAFNDDGAFHGPIVRGVLENLDRAGELEVDAARLQSLLLLTTAMEEAFLGRFQRARDLVARARPEMISGIDPSGVGAFIELRAGDLEAARRRLARRSGISFLRERLGSIIAALENRESPGEPTGMFSDPAITAALRGDGAKLDAELRAKHFHSTLPSRIALLWPYLPPAIIADHLAYARHISTFELEHDVDATIGYLANRAHAARSAGLDELAAQLAGTAIRLREASQRREIAVPLAVLEAM